LSNLRCTNLILLTLMSILILSVTLSLGTQAPASNQASVRPPTASEQVLVVRAVKIYPISGPAIESDFWTPIATSAGRTS
jgi:hypothetical protein